MLPVIEVKEGAVVSVEGLRSDDDVVIVVVCFLRFAYLLLLVHLCQRMGQCQRKARSAPEICHQVPAAGREA